MKNIKTIITFFIALLVINSVSAQGKMKLAVLDPVVAGEKLTDGLRISVREIVSSTFVNNAENYSIVERSLLDKVMQEAKFSNSDAVDESQATQLGKLAGADRVVLTVISRFESRCMISIKLINVETATIDQQISKMVDYNSVLDVTEPLTLAVLGKGDGSILVSNVQSITPNAQTKPQPQSQPQSNTQSRQTFAATKTQPSAMKRDAEFKGSGISFVPTGYNISYQPDELLYHNMGKLITSPSYNVIVDFSETTVVGRDMYDYVHATLDQEKLDKFGPNMQRLFEALNDDKKYNFQFNATLPITLVIKVRDVDEHGRVNTSDFVFVDTATGENIAGTRIKSKGGRFGSFFNLMGDAFEEDAAPKFLKQFKSAIKKYKK